jgi:polyhydroxyalkanoate synthesis regulator phasin
VTEGNPVRTSIERAVLLSIGAASLTRERAEAAVAELVHAGQVRGDEGRAIVDRLMARVRGESAPLPGLLGRLEEGVQGAMREAGLVGRAELEEVLLRLAELEHRLGLLERPLPAAAPPADLGLAEAPPPAAEAPPPAAEAPPPAAEAPGGPAPTPVAPEAPPPEVLAPERPAPGEPPPPPLK